VKTRKKLDRPSHSKEVRRKKYSFLKKADERELGTKKNLGRGGKIRKNQGKRNGSLYGEHKKGKKKELTVPNKESEGFFYHN